MQPYRQIMQELGFDEQAPDESKGNGKPQRKYSWRMEVVQALIKAGIANSPPKAVLMLNQSTLEPGISPEAAVAWFKEHNKS